MRLAARSSVTRQKNEIAVLGIGHVGVEVELDLVRVRRVGVPRLDKRSVGNERVLRKEIKTKT